MTQRINFIFWFLVSSGITIIFALDKFIRLSTISGFVPVGVAPSTNNFTFIIVRDVLIRIGINGIIIFIGLYCCQKIGMNFLLLHNQSDARFEKISKPAIISIVYAIIIFFVDKALRIGTFSFASFSALFKNAIFECLFVVQQDLFIILFCIGGLVFLIQKITRKASLSIIMPISIVLVALVGKIVDLFLYEFNYYITPSSMDKTTYLLGGLMGSFTILLIGAIAWKKGFEIAIVCHVIIVLIVRMLAPLLWQSFLAYY